MVNTESSRDKGTVYCCCKRQQSFIPQPSLQALGWPSALLLFTHPNLKVSHKCKKVRVPRQRVYKPKSEEQRKHCVKGKVQLSQTYLQCQAMALRCTRTCWCFQVPQDCYQCRMGGPGLVSLHTGTQWELMFREPSGQPIAASRSPHMFSQFPFGVIKFAKDL